MQTKNNKPARQSTTQPEIPVLAMGPEVYDALDLGLAIGHPVSLLGPAGCGKSSIPIQWARERGIPYSIKNLCDAGPQEATGYGIPKPDGSMPFACPDWIPSRAKVGDGPFIQILDEYANWDQVVKGASHAALHAAPGEPRFIGTHEIGRGVMFVLTSNRREDAKRGASPFSVPVVNRVMTYLVTLTPGGWADWAVREGYNDTFLPAWVNSLTPGEKGEYAMFHPPLSNWDGYSPIPTGRSLEMAAKTIIHFTRHGLGKLDLQLALASVVGWAAAASIITYRGLAANVASLAEMQANPSGVTIPSDKGHQFAMATVAYSAASRLSREDIAHGRADWYATLLDRMTDEVSQFYVDRQVNLKNGFENLPPVTAMIKRFAK